MPAASALASVAYFAHYAFSRWRPHAASPDQGWWRFTDQGRYLRSTLAWAAGNLDPAEHWYLPGYPLLGAPFVHLTPANPYLVSDLALLLASLWLTAAIAARLAPAWTHARLAGALVFLATSVLPPFVLEVWVIPWTTTPTAAASLACLLATLHVCDAPVTARSWRPVLAAALCAVTLAAFRPSDAAVVGAACGAAIAVRLVVARPGWKVAIRVTAPALLAASMLAAALTALYWVLYGWTLSPYVAVSAYIGFEWRILPLQWVEIVLSAQPLLPESGGLVSRMPWIIPGLAGMAACLAAPPFGARRRLHVVAIGLVVIQMAEYLAYRDLHPPGLWRNLNFHYFKWLFPVFGLYGVLLGAVLAQRRWAGLAAAFVATLAAVPWRAELVNVHPADLPVQTGRVAAIPAGMGVWDALLIPAKGDPSAIYNGTHSYDYGPDFGTWYGSLARLVAYPVAGGAMLVPVFQPPPGPGRAVFDTGVTVIGDRPAYLARQHIAFGVPCFLSTRLYRLRACARPEEWLSGRAGSG